MTRQACSSWNEGVTWRSLWGAPSKEFGILAMLYDLSFLGTSKAGLEAGAAFKEQGASHHAIHSWQPNVNNVISREPTWQNKKPSLGTWQPSSFVSYSYFIVCLTVLNNWLKSSFDFEGLQVATAFQVGPGPTTLQPMEMFLAGFFGSWREHLFQLGRLIFKI